ncbi:MAG TPA: glycosyltransferase family 4 protein [Gemmatimonadaceae bacterium]|nr:glycosyltransferase family 4 protein [Gemmatimonadaceae bacterium]
MVSQTYDNVAVLHVVAPGAVGGLESVVLALTTGQAARGDRVHVAVILDGQKPDKHTFTDALAVDHSVIALPARAYGRERAAVADLCARLRPEVVHTHGYRTDVIDSGVARRMKIATVTTVHGFTGIGGWKGRLYEYLQRRAFRRFDAVVAVSRPLIALLNRDGISRVHLVPNAYAPRPFVPREEARRILGLGEGFIAGWIGRLSREKAPDVFVTALTRTEGVSGAIIGSGRETPPASDRVTLLGQIPDAARFITAFDVLVLSSRTEGTPIVLFEAMAAHVPVVTTAVGGVPDVVSEREAILVPAGNPDALAAAIAKVRDDPAAAFARADAAAQRLATEYAVGPWIERYAAVYRSVL